MSRSRSIPRPKTLFLNAIIYSKNMAKHEKKFYPKFRGISQFGALKLDHDSEFKRYLRTLDGKRVEVVVKQETKDRSRQEEKFYHGVVVRMVAEAMQIQDQEAHLFLKDLFLKIEEKSPAGFRYERVLSTVELTDQSYREYWENCIKWAALPTLPEGLSVSSGLELSVPYPNEIDYSNW
jgi:hypothetical protein